MHGIVQQMVSFGQTVVALMPVLLVLGPFGMGAGLMLAMQFLALALPLIMAISLVLTLLMDPFDHDRDCSQ